MFEQPRLPLFFFITRPFAFRSRPQQQNAPSAYAAAALATPPPPPLCRREANPSSADDSISRPAQGETPLSNRQPPLQHHTREIPLQQFRVTHVSSSPRSIPGLPKHPPTSRPARQLLLAIQFIRQRPGLLSFHRHRPPYPSAAIGPNTMCRHRPPYYYPPPPAPLLPPPPYPSLPRHKVGRHPEFLHGPRVIR